ncbi:hypothetical protein EI94DRAFT_1749461 [Lactarius quietus]|nr:hypothetical protein EI94DRAFT_1749461 [Lactarius quietus]
MAYTNSYKEPEKPTLLPGYFGPDPYDINWAFPLYEEALESERVKLTPFIPSVHAYEYAAQVNAQPDLYQWYPFELSSLDQILTEVELRARPWEIGWVAIFPCVPPHIRHLERRGHLLRYALELPSPDTGRGGLGFRRVQWTAHTGNKPSHATARRMGLKEECVIRWSHVMFEGAESYGLALRKGDPLSERPGRHIVVLSLCADEWEDGGREHVEREMKRGL